jgi:murein L,D-transpeptidase YcbB/YkuD
MRFVVTVLLISIGIGMKTGGVWADVPSADALRVILRDKINQEQRQTQFTCRNELICGIADLPLFYARRGFRPAWVTQSSLSKAESLIRAIRVAGLDGLRIADYHADTIDRLLDSVVENRLCDTPIEPETFAELDLLLTDAFLMLGSHLMAGRVNAETIHAEWTVHHPEADLAQVLESALESDQIESALDNLRPPHHGYRALKSALNRYREIAVFGGWPLMEKHLSWQKGDFGTHIAQLKERLESTGDLEPVAESYDDGYMFDDLLVEGIRRFQARHGLPESGTIDVATFAALNVPVDVRARQIELNLERWRWIPHDLGEPHILVNVADFNLTVVVAGQPQWGMRVVVGRDYRRTPVFSADLTYLVINPYWNIPRKIAVEDILPKARRDPDYLIKNRIKVFESWKENAREINPYAIDWSKVTKRNFAFKLRKEPGPANDLGRIKFMLPNKYAVYLHDTPNRKLFKRYSRTFSSGCIRLERPLDLAGYLLKDNPKWSRKNILKAIRSEEGNKIVRLGKPVPVHLLYWTAWVDHQGRVNFRDDIYGRDPLLDVALKERPPSIGSKESNQRDMVSATWPSR